MTNHFLFVENAPVINGSLNFPDCFEKPSQWQQLPIAWEDDYEPAIVFIGQTELPNGYSAYVFGRRLELSFASIEDPAFDGLDGHFVEFFVVENEEQSFHYLTQDRNVIYTSNEKNDGYTDCSKMTNREIDERSFKTSPKWNKNDAQWPTVDSECMTFVAQFDLPENDVTKAHLTWNIGIFLFWHKTPTTRFGIARQSSNYQTLEDHYSAGDTGDPG